MKIPTFIIILLIGCTNFDIIFQHLILRTVPGFENGAMIHHNGIKTYCGNIYSCGITICESMNKDNITQIIMEPNDDYTHINKDCDQNVFFRLIDIIITDEHVEFAIAFILICISLFLVCIVGGINFVNTIYIVYSKRSGKYYDRVPSTRELIEGSKIVKLLNILNLLSQISVLFVSILTLFISIYNPLPSVLGLTIILEIIMFTVQILSFTDQKC